MCCHSCCSCCCSNHCCSCGGGSTPPSYPDADSGRSYPIWLSVPAFISRRGGRAVDASLGYGF